MRVAFCYIVGGQDKQYINLDKALKSLERLKGIEPKIYILEFGDRIKSDPSQNIIVIHKNNIFNNTTTYVNHKAWQAKYEICQIAMNDGNANIVYVDNDTVFVNNTIERLFTQLEGKFGITQHFWVPTIEEYGRKAVEPDDYLKYIHTIYKIMHPNNQAKFAAGGIFLFENNPNNGNIIHKVKEINDYIYPNDNSPYIKGFTDELVLSLVLDQIENVEWLPGALNHCAMLEMPLYYEDSILKGKNPWELDSHPVTVFHCDTFRRDPGKNWDFGDKIRKMFYL